MHLENVIFASPILYIALLLVFYFIIFKLCFGKKSISPNHPLRIVFFGTSLIGGGFLAYMFFQITTHAHDSESIASGVALFVTPALLMLLSAYTFLHVWAAAWALRSMYLYFIKREEGSRKRSLIGIVVLIALAFEISGYVFIRCFP